MWSFLRKFRKIKLLDFRPRSMGVKSRSNSNQFFEKNKFLDRRYRNSKRAPTRATRRDLLQRSYNNAGIFESPRCNGRNYRRRRLSYNRLVSLILYMTIYQ